MYAEVSDGKFFKELIENVIPGKKQSEVKSSNCHYKDKNQFEECIREIIPT